MNRRHRLRRWLRRGMYYERHLKLCALVLPAAALVFVALRLLGVVG